MISRGNNIFRHPLKYMLFIYYYIAGLKSYRLVFIFTDKSFMSIKTYIFLFTFTYVIKQLHYFLLVNINFYGPKNPIVT